MTYSGPAVDASCVVNTLVTFGDTDCAQESTIEIGEITELIFSEKHATTLGVPKNPITGWVDSSTNGAVNETAILTWIATAAKTGVVPRRMPVIGSIPAPQGISVTLPKGGNYLTGKTRIVNFETPIADQAQYMNVWRKFEGGTKYHVWFTTEKGLYGGLNGILADVQAEIIFEGQTPKRLVGTVTFKHTYSPPRDNKPFV